MRGTRIDSGRPVGGHCNNGGWSCGGVDGGWVAVEVVRSGRVLDSSGGE